MNKTEFSETNM